MKREPPNSVITSKHVHLTLRGIDQCRRANPVTRPVVIIAALVMLSILTIAAIWWLRRG